MIGVYKIMMKIIILILVLIALIIASNLLMLDVNARQCFNNSLAPFPSFCGAGEQAKSVQLCDNSCNCQWVTQCY